MAPKLINHISVDGKRVAWIPEANRKVIEIVADKLAYGWSPEEMCLQHLDLSLAQIHAALAYLLRQPGRDRCGDRTPAPGSGRPRVKPT